MDAWASWVGLFTVCLLAASTAVDAAVVEDVFEVPVTVRTIYDQVSTQNIQVTSWRDDSREKAPFPASQPWQARIGG